MRTVNYEMFRFFKSNRDVKSNRVDDLIKSMQKHGFVKSKSILVDEDFNVIDGQHRLEAAKRLGIEVYYEIIQDADEGLMIDLNKTQKDWRLEDYVHYYALAGIPNYAALIEFGDKYKLGISNNISIFIGSNMKGPQIRSGQSFKINKNYKEITNFILDAKNYLGFYKNSNFVKAVVALFAKAELKEINKLSSKIGIINRQASVNDYLILFENILNKNRHDKNKISLR